MTQPIQDLDAWRWLVGSEAKHWLDEVASLTGEELQRKCSKGLNEAKARLLIEQASLRKQAAKKFADPQRWLWTTTLLEQSSDEATSQLTASFFPESESVMDLCCGAGADAVALATRGKNTSCEAWDRSPIAALLTESNLRSHRARGEVHCDDVERMSWSKAEWIHIDPDRRPEGGRTTDLRWCLPNQEFLAKLPSVSSGGSIKLAPATQIPTDWETRFGRQWIGVDGSVRQQRVWWGSDRFPMHSRTVSIQREAYVWSHLLFDEATIHDSLDRIGPMLEGMQFLGDCDPVVRAASLTPCVAGLCNAQVVGDMHGYLISDTPISSDYVDWFEILDILSLDLKKLRKHLRSKSIGQLEIKKRGVEMDIDRLRKEMELEGSESATLILLRDGAKRFGVLARRRHFGSPASLTVKDH